MSWLTPCAQHFLPWSCAFNSHHKSCNRGFRSERIGSKLPCVKKKKGKKVFFFTCASWRWMGGAGRHVWVGHRPGYRGGDLRSLLTSALTEFYLPCVSPSSSIFAAYPIMFRRHRRPALRVSRLLTLKIHPVKKSLKKTNIRLEYAHILSKMMAPRYRNPKRRDSL